MSLNQTLFDNKFINGFPLKTDPRTMQKVRLDNFVILFKTSDSTQLCHGKLNIDPNNSFLLHEIIYIYM